MFKGLTVWLILLLALPVDGQNVSFGAGVKVGAGVGAVSTCSGNAAITRTIPTGMPTPPITPACVLGPGNVIMNESLLTAFTTANPAVLTASNIVTIDPVHGNDSSCSRGSAIPCATFTQVLKHISGVGGMQINFICPPSGIFYGTSTLPFDFRYSDPAGQQPVLIVSQNQGCKLAIFGDTIGTNTWTATGGHANTYQTTIASASANTSGIVQSVYLTDTNDPTYVDIWGRPFPARISNAFPPPWDSDITYSSGQIVYFGNRNSAPCYQSLQNGNLNNAVSNVTWWATTSCDTAGLANLDALTTGFYYSVSTFTLYAKLNGADLTNPANAARLGATYWQVGNNAPRFLIDGTTVMMVGFELFGIGYNNSDFFDGTNYHAGHLYEQQGTVFLAAGYGHQQRGADVYSYQTVTYANQFDGFNTDLGADSATAHPYVGTQMIANSWSLYNGDPEQYINGTVPAFPNLNAESSHNGYGFYFGFVGQDNYGPECADGQNPSTTPVIPSMSWYVGSVCFNVNPVNTLNVSGIQMQGVPGSTFGDPRNRQEWIDTSHMFNEGIAPVSVQNNAACKIYNIITDVPIQYIATTTQCQPYTPNAP